MSQCNIVFSLFLHYNQVVSINYFVISKKVRVNEEIRAPQMRLIEGEDEMIGVVSREEALQRAKAAELDLVEISPNAEPPVCKIMDFGKYLYRLNKTDRKHKAKQKKTETKEVRIGFSTGEHDLEVKAKRAIKFLRGRDRVKITLQFKGREISHFDLGKEKLQSFVDRLAEHGKLDEEIKKQGRNLIVIIKPPQT
ncbi:MAG: translation initiation factor IF-3 [Candidatus Gracilibacteria bacterium]|nr:translation initiation factor IF-3 [Candidatus Gracilibacteria bacterium]